MCHTNPAGVGGWVGGGKKDKKGTGENRRRCGRAGGPAGGSENNAMEDGKKAGLLD